MKDDDVTIERSVAGTDREARAKAMLGALKRAGRRLAATRKATDEALTEARILAVGAITEGIVSEHQAAKLLQVDRMTVRNWLGKEPSAFAKKSETTE
jgi:hypothetical protein